MISEILTELKKRKNLQGWKLIKKETRKFQRYLINQKTETDLEAHKINYTLVVYVKKEKTLGEGIVSIIGEDDIEDKIAQAIILAKNSLSKTYPLAKKELIKKVKTADPYIVRSFSVEICKDDIARMEKHIRDTIKKHKKVRLASAELSISLSTSRIITSTGIDVKQDKTRVFTDLALVAASKGKEMDFTPQWGSCTYKDFNLKELTNTACIRAIDSLNATLAKEFQGNIVLSEEALKDIFYPPVAQCSAFVFQCLGRLKYKKMIAHKKGSKICNNLTLTNDPTLCYGYESTSFDSDGLAVKPEVIIENGKIKNFLAAHKYSKYLNTKRISPLSNMVIKPGLKNFKVQGKYIEVVKFSSFIPNSMTGDFSAEVRLGYVIENEKRTPFRGGLLVGNLFKTKIEFGKDIAQDMGYIGPKEILIKAKLSAH